MSEPVDMTTRREIEMRTELACRAATVMVEARAVYSVEEFRALVSTLEEHTAARRACATLAMDDAESNPLRAAMLAGIDLARFS